MVERTRTEKNRGLQSIMKEVNCFGSKKFELIGEPFTITKQRIRVWNEKTQDWYMESECAVVETICPVCRDPILWRYYPMSWSSSICSEECLKIKKECPPAELHELMKYGKNYKELRKGDNNETS